MYREFCEMVVVIRLFAWLKGAECVAERGGNWFGNVGFGVEKQGVWDCVVAEKVVECWVLVFGNWGLVWRYSESYVEKGGWRSGCGGIVL